ncbi:MAG: GNAT family N-acetyltransferase [Firmicutes bacterium]|nr:GNAT family N-acetyltransferase [Bacillota bacterium]
MVKEYKVEFAKTDDLDPWMDMATEVRNNFPGLETSKQLESYRQTVIKNINRQTAICVKDDVKIVGVLLFSYNSSCISCMAVHPDYRRKGIASEMIKKMLSLFPDDINISVTTFREDDEKGIAPRSLYKKFGFIEGELIEEFDYPHQRFILHRS